jgi:hypothetical protein
MHPALREVSDARERGKVVNRAWRRYGAVNSLALAALIAGWAGARPDASARRRPSARERKLTVAKDTAVAVVAVTGVAAAIEGVRFSRMKPGGAVPLADGSEPGGEASPGEERAKRRLNVLGGAHLTAAVALAAVNAALDHATPTVTSRRRWRPSFLA